MKKHTGFRISAVALSAVLSVVLLASVTAMLLSACAGEKRQEEKEKQPEETEQKVNSIQVEGVPDIEEGNQAEILRFVDAWGEWHETEVNPAVKKHDYDWSCLVNNKTDIQYMGDERYVLRKGIDVSQHQGYIDWGRVKAAGYDFAILRIGYRGYGTEGLLCIDETFHTNIANAQDAGIDVGVYFFSQAVSEEETLEEAQLVLDNLAGYELQLPVVFDPERIRDDTARTDGVSGEQFTRNTILFCEKMKEAGYQPMVYGNMVWESFEFDMEQLAGYPIWYADYEAVPQTPYDFTFWQFTEKGYVDGVEGQLDLDVQFCRTEQGIL